MTESGNYLDALAEKIRREVLDGSPRDPRDVALFRIYAVLATVAGTEVTARDVHDAWVAWMLQVNPRHRWLVPYEELPPAVAARDDAYMRAIRKVAASLRAPVRSAR